MTRRALIVEDESILRDFLTMDLRASGFEVITAGDGLEASALLAEQTFDVVISDVTIPHKTGVELFREICTSHPSERPAFVLISGEFPLPHEDLYALGIEHCIDKPFSRQTLVESIQRLTLPVEQRWARRKGVPEPVAELQMEFEGLIPVQKQKLFSIGRSGFFVALSAPYPEVNDVIDFKIVFQRLPEATENQPLNGRGVVRWVREKAVGDSPSGIGIEFLFLAPQSLRVFEELLGVVKPTACIPRA